MKKIQKKELKNQFLGLTKGIVDKINRSKEPEIQKYALGELIIKGKPYQLQIELNPHKLLWLKPDQLEKDNKEYINNLSVRMPFPFPFTMGADFGQEIDKTVYSINVNGKNIELEKPLSFEGEFNKGQQAAEKFKTSFMAFVEFMESQKDKGLSHPDSHNDVYAPGVCEKALKESICKSKEVIDEKLEEIHKVFIKHNINTEGTVKENLKGIFCLFEEYTSKKSE